MQGRSGTARYTITLLFRHLDNWIAIYLCIYNGGGLGKWRLSGCELGLKALLLMVKAVKPLIVVLCAKLTLVLIEEWYILNPPITPFSTRIHRGTGSVMSRTVRSHKFCIPRLLRRFWLIRFCALLFFRHSLRSPLSLLTLFSLFRGLLEHLSLKPFFFLDEFHKLLLIHRAIRKGRK